MSKIKFKICHSSAEDPEYPAEELNAHSPHTKGWQSPQFCDYPQELGLSFEAPARITQVQILSHQSKIATKIELFVGHGDTYNTAQFRRLGYLSLDSNGRSKFQARELKSVYVDAPGQYLRMFVHKCYINELNLFNQVGIIAVNLLGELLGPGLVGALEEDPTHGPGNWHGHGPHHSHSHGAMAGAPGSGIQARAKRRDLDDLSFDMNFDPETAHRIREIAAAKDEAVRREDFDTAKLLKEAEMQLQALGSKLAQLEVAKREAVEDEDYDRAKMLKVEATALRMQMEAHPRPEVWEHLAQMDQQEHGERHGVDIHAGADFGGASHPVTRRDVFNTHGEGPDTGGKARSRSRSPAGRGLNVEEQPVGTNSKPWGSPSRAGGGEGRFVEGQGSARMPRVPGLPLNGASTAGEEVDGDGDGSQGGSQEFEDGEHPLLGVPGVEDLPSPEALSTNIDLSEVQGLNSMFGSYITRCLYSKTWSLREAAILKVKLLLPELVEDPGLTTALPNICQILRVGCEDKIAQVFLSTLELLSATLAVIKAHKDVRHNTTVALLEPTVNTLLVKLGDGQARVRDGAMSGLMAVARCRTAGPAFVSHISVKPLQGKQLTAWRPIKARLNLLQQLVSEFGIGTSSSLSADNMMTFAKGCNGFAHSNGQVRDAARELTVEVYNIVGEEVERHLTALRPKQLDEYREAFREADRVSGRTPKGTTARSAAEEGQDAATNRGGHSARGGKPASGSAAAGASKGGRSQPSPAKSGRRQQSPPPPVQAPPDDPGDEGEGASLDFTCQFCGKYDPSFSDENLDLHYWQQCPLLMSCNECGQVVEISSMTEHLLDECQNGEDFVECEVSGLAVRKGELSKWSKSKHCKPPGKGGPGSTCPLCFKDLGSAEEEAWQAHLTQSCPRNPRRA